MGRRATEESKSVLLKPIFGSKVGFFMGSNLDLVAEGSFLFNGLADQLSGSMQSYSAELRNARQGGCG